MALRKWKKKDKNNKIVLCGCMPQQKEGKYNLKTKLPFVDIILGTHNINSMAEQLIRNSTDGKRIHEIIEAPVGPMDIDGCVRDDKTNAYELTFCPSSVMYLYPLF